MAYTKKVQGRSYPYLYNISMTVGSYQKVIPPEERAEREKRNQESADRLNKSLGQQRTAWDMQRKAALRSYEAKVNQRKEDAARGGRYDTSNLPPKPNLEPFNKKPVKPLPVPQSETAYGPNKRDDVMLVQYLLKRVYQQGHRTQPPLNQANGTAELKVDGLYGPKTQKAITDFQLEMRRNGRSIATDGCVDPERGDSTTSSISKTGYTISWLNEYFWNLYPELAPNIAVDPECPPELKASLNQNAMAA